MTKRARDEEEDVEIGPSEPEILRLVAARESARQARRFDEADQVREQLRSMGVELYDKDKSWRSKDGRRGSMFTAGPVECVLSDHEIEARVQQREEARKSKDWDMADRLREDLRSNGVELNDREMTWRTATGRQGTYSGMQPAAHMSGSQIRRLIAERERHRSTQDFESADAVRQQLQAMGVEVYDNERLWRCSDGRQGFIITGGAEVDCYLSDDEIQSQVLARERMRSMKEWDKADAIRDELRRVGCELLDTTKMWCTTDGRSGTYTGVPLMTQQSPVTTPKAPSSTRVALAQQAAAHALQQAGVRVPSYAHGAGNGATNGIGAIGGGNMFSSNTIGTFTDASIQALIRGRERARERHDWVSADAIRTDLRSHGVEVWDKDKIWRAKDGRNGYIDA